MLGIEEAFRDLLARVTRILDAVYDGEDYFVEQALEDLELDLEGLIEEHDRALRSEGGA